MNHISEQLRDVISRYNPALGGPLLAGLSKDVQSGKYPTLEADLSTAIREGAFSPPQFGELVHMDWDDEDSDQLDATLRDLWDAVAPGKPYPGDQPSE